jgi:hypothetical protein
MAEVEWVILEEGGLKPRSAWAKATGTWTRRVTARQSRHAESAADMDGQHHSD